MVYRKGELSPAGVDRGWPYQVAVPFTDDIPLGHVCPSGPVSSLCRRGHEVSDGSRRYRVFCFSDPEQAKAFKASVGGEDFDPRDRGRGQAWGSWFRGRAAARDAARRK